MFALSNETTAVTSMNFLTEEDVAEAFLDGMMFPAQL